MGRFTVKIGGEEKVFKDADNLRRYVMRYGNKTKKYTYRGEGGMFIDRYGVMSYTQKGGWKVKLQSGDSYPIDKRTGEIFEGGRYTVRMAGKNEANVIASSDDFSDTIDRAITQYARNRGKKVYIYDKDKKLGRIGERSGYATWIDHKTKRTTSFKDDNYDVPKRPTGLAAPKQPGWIIAGRRAGSKGAFKYYSGESFAAKKYAMVWPYNKYEQAEKTIEELRWYGEYENYEFKIVRES